MAALLTADTATVLCHILVNILIAHSGLCVADALLIKSLVQTKIGHDGRDHSIGQQLAAFLHVAAVDVKDVVAGDDISLLVHAQATVGVTIVGKANIQALLHNKLLKALDMG